MNFNGKTIALKKIFFLIYGLRGNPVCFNLFQPLLKYLKTVLFCFGWLMTTVGQSQNLATGLVSHYTFCDCTATDFSGNNHHGTIIGNPKCSKGRLGNGLLFNDDGGINDCGQPGGQYVQLPPMDAIWSGGFSISAWVRFGDIKKYQRIIDFGNANGEAGGMNILFGREINSNNLILESWINNNGAQARTTGRLTAVNVIRTDSTQHLCATIRQDTMRIFVNGILVAQKKGNPIANVARTRNYIGRSLWCADDPDFKGLIEDVRIYNRSLSISEVKALYQEGEKDFAINTHCNSQQVDVGSNNFINADSLRWDFGDPSGGSSNLASGYTASHTYKDTGTYTVSLVVYKACLNDTISKTVRIYKIEKDFLGPDFAICPGITSLLNPNFSNASYTWQDGSAGENLSVSQPGIYSLHMRVGDCSYIDSVTIGSLRKFGFEQATVCEGQSVYNYSTSGIYRDTFALSNGCDSIRTLQLTVRKATRLENKIAICEGESYRLPWGQEVTIAGQFSDTARCQSGCDSLIRDFVVRINPLPTVRITKSNDIDCSVRTAILAATGGEKYSWTPANTVNNPIGNKTMATPNLSTVYHVRVTSGAGCSNSDSVLVRVSNERANEGFFVPSAFTPNGDGKNDYFGVSHWGAVKNLRFTVSNRWGEVVFRTNDALKSWDGTFRGQPQSSTTYVYVISADTECGSVMRRGTVVLIR